MKKILLSLTVLFLVGCGGQQEINTERTPVDIDMTQMSVTMVSAQALQLEMNPLDHIGQTVRIRGSHYYFFWEEVQSNVHYVVLDLTVGCCGSAFEFILSDDLIESVGYPPLDAVIELVGTYKYYTALGHTFYFFAVTEILVE